MVLKNKNLRKFLVLLAICFCIIWIFFISHSLNLTFESNEYDKQKAINIANRNKNIKEKINLNAKTMDTNPNMSRNEMRITLNSTQFLTRDYIYYQCKERRRIGCDKDDAWRPMPENNLERLFVCFDGNLEPIKNNCNILSFGTMS